MVMSKHYSSGNKQELKKLPGLVVKNRKKVADLPPTDTVILPFRGQRVMLDSKEN